MPTEVESGVYNLERGLPWHRLGVPADGAMYAYDVLRKAGLDWVVTKEPLYVEGFDGEYEIVDGSYAIQRSTDGAVLGVVGSRYVPIQNAEALRFLDELVGAGQAVYDSAWALRGGRTVAITIELDQIIPASGENIRTFLTMANSHDGNGQIRFMTTPVRVVCMNTLAMALEQHKLMYQKKHTANAMSEANVTEAREVLQLAQYYTTYLNETAKRLLAEAFDRRSMVRLAENLLVREKTEPSDYEMDQFDKLMFVYDNSDNLGNIRNTKWGGLNAVAEYLDYFGRYKGVNWLDNRAESLMDGRAVKVKTRAYEMLTR